MVRLGWRSSRFWEREVPLEARSTPSTQETAGRGAGRFNSTACRGEARFDCTDSVGVGQGDVCSLGVQGYGCGDEIPVELRAGRTVQRQQCSKL